MKLMMLGTVTPLLIDSLLIGYYFNRTGYFEAETLLLWFSLIALAAGGTWLTWRSFRQSLAPLETFIHAGDESISGSEKTDLTSISMDELGVLTSRYATLLSTQQQLAEELQQSQILANTFIDYAGALVVVLDHDGRIIRFNRACENISGFTSDEVVGRFPWDTFLPPEDAEFIRKNAFEIFTNNPEAMSGEFTNYWQTKQGERVLLEWVNTVVQDDQGCMKNVISVGVDVTERKHKEQMLRESEAQLREAQRIAKVGSWELDLVDNKLTWSDEIFTIFEIDKEKFGASYEAFINAIHPDDRAMVDNAYSGSLVDRKPYEITHRLKMSDGRIKYVQEACESDFDANGKPARSIGTVQDVTELYTTQEELKRHREYLEELIEERTTEMRVARDEAERANTAKSEFLSRMSHELRTPMNAILGFGQLLEMDADKLNEDQRSNVKEILAAGNHLLALINEVLDLSRIESGKMEVSMSEVHVDHVLKQCLALISPEAESHQLDIVDQLSDKGHIVKADSTRFKQVLLNLLSNAVKYNRDYGSITLNSDIIHKRLLRINIVDTGIGLSEDEIARLFTSFERLKNQNVVEGVGIGLVITKHLVELMGGSIGVEGTPGEGSTFWVEFELLNGI
jgi:PAS domain S-box-containing protein